MFSVLFSGKMLKLKADPDVLHFHKISSSQQPEWCSSTEYYSILKTIPSFYFIFLYLFIYSFQGTFLQLSVQ